MMRIITILFFSFLVFSVKGQSDSLLFNKIIIKDSLNSTNSSIKIVTNFYFRDSIFTDKPDEIKFRDEFRLNGFTKINDVIDLNSTDQRISFYNNNTLFKIIYPSKIFDSINKYKNSNTISFFVELYQIENNNNVFYLIKDWAYLGNEILLLYSSTGNLLWYNVCYKNGTYKTNISIKKIINRYNLEKDFISDKKLSTCKKILYI